MFRGKSSKPNTECSCIVLDNGTHTILEEKWEHEKFLGWWTVRFSEKYRTEDGGQSRMNVTLPIQWDWGESIWEVDREYTITDKDGWVYAIHPNMKYHAKPRVVDVVRKRKWIRRREWTGPVGGCATERGDAGRVLDVVRQGWLRKHDDNMLRRSHMRFFLLVGGDTELRYYNDDPGVQNRTKPRGIIPLSSVTKTETFSDASNPAFPYGFIIHCQTRSYRLSCTTADDRDEWQDTINQFVETARGTWRSTQVPLRECAEVHVKTYRLARFEIVKFGILKMRGKQAGWKTRIFMLVPPGYLFLFKSFEDAEKFRNYRITRKNYNDPKFILRLSTLALDCCSVIVRPREMRKIDAYKKQRNILTVKMTNNQRFYFGFEEETLRNDLEAALRDISNWWSKQESLSAWVDIEGPTSPKSLVVPGYDDHRNSSGKRYSKSPQPRRTSHEHSKSNRFRRRKSLSPSKSKKKKRRSSPSRSKSKSRFSRSREVSKSYTFDFDFKDDVPDTLDFKSSLESDLDGPTSVGDLNADWMDILNHPTQKDLLPERPSVNISTQRKQRPSVISFVADKASKFGEKINAMKSDVPVLQGFDDLKLKMEEALKNQNEKLEELGQQVVEDTERYEQKVISYDSTEKFSLPAEESRRQALQLSDYQKQLMYIATGIDAAFDDIKDEAELTIWRVRNFTVEPWPGVDYGVFNDGDTFLIANPTFIVVESKKHELTGWNVHYWIGSKSATCERAVAAMKAIELSRMLGAGVIHFRETQGNEGEALQSYFPNGIKIREDGIETALEPIPSEEEMFETRLLHIKGLRYPVVRQIAVDWKNLNSGDVFILDTYDNIYLWTGNEANVWEQVAGMQIAQKIKDSRLTRHKFGTSITFLCECTIMEEHKLDECKTSHEDEIGFWESLGTPNGRVLVKPADEVDDDRAVERILKLYEWTQTEANDVVFTEIKRDDDGMLSKSQLKPIHEDHRNLKPADPKYSRSVYVLDCQSEMFLWKGRHSGPVFEYPTYYPAHAQQLAMESAAKWLNEVERPDHTTLTVMTQNAETPLFKSKFKDWGDEIYPIDSLPKQKYLPRKRSADDEDYQTLGDYLGFETPPKEDLYDMDFFEVHQQKSPTKRRKSIPKSNTLVYENKPIPYDFPGRRHSVSDDESEEETQDEEELFVYVYDGTALEEIEPDGFFQSDRCYVIVHTFTIPKDYSNPTRSSPRYGENPYIVFFEDEDKNKVNVENKLASDRKWTTVYFWQGRDCANIDFILWRFKLHEYFTGAVQEATNHVPSEMAIVQQNREPPRFLRLFDEGMIVIKGKNPPPQFRPQPEKKEGEQAQNEEKAKTPKKYIKKRWRKKEKKEEKDDFSDYTDWDTAQLYHIQGTDSHNVRAIQVECVTTNLNSGDVFVLCGSEKVYAWYGKYSLPIEREICIGVLDRLMGERELVNLVEGGETDDFWALFKGGNHEYCTVPDGQSDMFAYLPRMLLCTFKTANFRVQEILMWSQQDLTEYSSIILDATAQIFLWFGIRVLPKERTLVKQFAKKYIKTCPKGRTTKSCPIVETQQHHEPPEFKSCFHGWKDDFRCEFVDPYLKTQQRFEDEAVFGRVVPYKLPPHLGFHKAVRMVPRRPSRLLPRAQSNSNPRGVVDVLKIKTNS